MNHTKFEFYYSDKINNIENERKEKVKLAAQKILEKRNNYSKKLEEEYLNYLILREKENIEVRRNIKENINNMQIIKVKENIIQKSVEENVETPQIPPTIEKKPDKENIETKIIQEPFDIKKFGINTIIPFTEDFCEKFILCESVKEIKTRIENNKSATNAMKIKLLINKRLTQLTKDIEHVRRISETLISYKNDPVFVNSFADKILDQGKVQVSLHNDSFKSYAYLLMLVITDDLLNIFRFKLFTLTNLNKEQLKGCFLIYFGFLKLNKLSEEAWYFIEKIISVRPSENTLVVIETFLDVFHKEMKSFFVEGFYKLRSFLKMNFEEFKKCQAEKMRMSVMISEYIK